MELILLGHIIGEFYVQTDKIAEKKKNSLKFMSIHCLIYALIIGICFHAVNKNEGKSFIIFVLLFLTHFCIDLIKSRLEKNSNGYEWLTFLADQMTHIAMLVCWKPAAIFISLIFKLIPETVEKADKETENQSKGANEGIKIGSWIGILEREIMLMLGLLGQYGAIGFVLTAKSLARFKQLENKAFAEKYLVGTLLSALIAIACIAMCKVYLD